MAVQSIVDTADPLKGTVGTSIGSRLDSNLTDLYDNTIVTVSGDASPQTKYRLIENGKLARASIQNRMAEERLYTGDLSNIRRYHVTDIEPDDGIINAYTDGDVVRFNSYTLPTEKAKYGTFKKTIRGMGGQLGRYLTGKFGTAEAAEYSNKRTNYHEEIHNLLQLNPVYTEEGRAEMHLRLHEQLQQNPKRRKGNIFAEALYTRLKQRYKSSLPKWARWLAPLFAQVSYRPMIEGMAEVGTENGFNGKSAYKASHDFKKGPTTYDMYGAAAGEAIDSTGSRDLFEYTRKWTEKPTEMLDKYIDSFYDSMGGLAGGEQMASLRPLPASYLKAA